MRPEKTYPIPAVDICQVDHTLEDVTQVWIDLRYRVIPLLAYFEGFK